MGEMKHTPEEIKKGLEMCAAEKGGCMGCPYRHDSMSGCITLKASDALAYIQQLEAQGSKRINVEEMLKKKRIKTAEELLKAVEHCKEDRDCRKCKYFGRGSGEKVFPCMSVMLQDIYDFIVYHKAILAEAERWKGNAGDN